MFYLEKSVYSKISFLISQPKHMLWVLKNTISLRLSTQNTFLLMEKKIIKILRSMFFCLSEPIYETVNTCITFPTIHHNCCLLNLLIIFFGVLYCEQYGSRSDYSLGAVLLEFIVFAPVLKLDWICSAEMVSRHHFLDKRYKQDKS